MRIGKFSADGAILFHYDDAGHLLMETDSVGTLIRAYVWAEDMPIAQITKTSTGEVLTYLHTDYLNTPRLATDTTGKVVWRWEGKAFGDTAPNEDPTNSGVKTTINLRFAGQYYDKETGLHYNWNNYYNPALGRTLMPDRISVADHAEFWKAGLGTLNQPPLEINPYAPVGNNPLRWTDPTGESIQVVVYCAAAAFIAYNAYSLYNKYSCQRTCQLNCAEKYLCKDGNCPSADGDNRGLTNCKSECVLKCWGGMGKKGPMGPTPGGPVTNPPYIPPSKLD